MEGRGCKLCEAVRCIALILQLFVVEKYQIKVKAGEKQQEKALQQQSPKVEVKEAVQETHKPMMAEVYNNDLQTLRIWYDSKQFTKELKESIIQLPKSLFSDDTIEYYLQEMVKKRRRNHGNCVRNRLIYIQLFGFIISFIYLCTVLKFKCYAKSL